MYSIHRSATIIRIFLLAFCTLLVSFNKAQAQGSAAVRVINTSGGGTVTMVIRNRDGTESTDGIIRWTGDSAMVGKWQTADQYIEISHEELDPTWGIQIYTDNKNSDPAYTGKTNPAGLVKVDNSTITIAMAWRITDKQPWEYDPEKPEADPYADENKIERDDYKGMTSYLWHFIKDKNTPDDPATPDRDEFINGEEYITVWSQKGIAWNEGGKAGHPKKAYIYFAARLTTAPIGVEYKTTTLTLEAYKGISPFPIYLYKDASKALYPDEEGATLENHFSPSGWMNYDDAHKIITVDPKYKNEVEPHSEPHCFEITWNGNAGVDGWKWGGIMWLEPEDIWKWKKAHPDEEHPTHNGYDLRGTTHLSFWARTDDDNVGLRLLVYMGNSWDSCGEEIPAIIIEPALTTTWQEYRIENLDGYDMSDVTGGFAVIFNDIRDPTPDDGCVIYLDDIKFDIEE